MKNKRKITTLLLALTLLIAFAFTGCGSNEAAPAAEPAAETKDDTAVSETKKEEAAQETEKSAAEDLGELQSVLDNGKIIIGIEGTYPPFTYHADNGDLTGLDVELGQAIAEQLGVEAEFVEAAWDSLLIGVDSGRFDTVINSVSITDERLEKYDFSDPYYYEGRRVVVRSDDDSIKTEDDLGGKKIATNVTNAFIPWYEEHGAEVVGIDTSGEAIELVLSGRADFCGTSVPVLNAYLEEHPEAEAKLKVAFVIPNSEDVIAIPVRKGESAFLGSINDALKALRENGKLVEISNKYLGGDYTNSAF